MRVLLGLRGKAKQPPHGCWRPRRASLGMDMNLRPEKPNSLCLHLAFGYIILRQQSELWVECLTPAWTGDFALHTG